MIWQKAKQGLFGAFRSAEKTVDPSLLRYDLHIHSSQVSLCAHLPAEDMVRRYKDAGYAGFVLTDHYNRPYMDSFGLEDWEQKAECFLSGYRAARSVGEEIGFTVLLGMELQLGGSSNEYLLYGLTEAFLKAHPSLYEMDLVTLRTLCDENGILIVQAHPYRSNMTRAMPGFLDGMEVFNANPRHNSRNEMALQYATQHNLLQTSGSDAHEPEDVGRGGILVSEPIQTVEQLVSVLKSGAYRLIKNK